MPGEIIDFKMIVFGRREGFHSFESLKIYDLINNAAIKYKKPLVQVE